MITELRIDSGIDMAMIMVLRQLPRKSRIIIAVRAAAMIASRIKPVTAAIVQRRDMLQVLWTDPTVSGDDFGSQGIAYLGGLIEEQSPVDEIP
jgi:hypothetical protein